MKCNLAEKYIGIEDDKYKNISVSELVDKYSSIIQNVRRVRVNQLEKKSQQLMILENNSNQDSKWFCVDIEYVLQLNNKRSDVGRFDIIAISKEKPHRVGLIELKVGTKGYDSAIDRLDKESGKKENLADVINKYEEEIKSFTYKYTLGSGVLGHSYDFIRYMKEDYYNSYLKKEIVNIIKGYHELGIITPFEDSIYENDFCEKPEIYFITVSDKTIGDGGDRKKIIKSYQKSMKNYLFDNVSSKSEYNVEKVLGVNLTDPNAPIQPTFLFSADDGSNISDILESELYECGLDN